MNLRMAMGSKARPVARCIPEDGAYANWEVELAARHLLALSEMRSPSQPLGSFDASATAPGIELARDGERSRCSCSIGCRPRRRLARLAARARWQKTAEALTAADAPMVVQRLLKTYEPKALRWANRDDRHAIVREILVRGDAVARRWLRRKPRELIVEWGRRLERAGP
jgi:hypothetical protein